MHVLDFPKLIIFYTRFHMVPRCNVKELLRVGLHWLRDCTSGLVAGLS